MIYLDTSVLVAAHTHEPESARVIDWMAAQRDPRFIISLWSLTEFASALSRQVRARRLTPDERTSAAAEFRIFREGVSVIAPEPDDFHLAAQMLANPDTGLRAADALHLAIVARTGARLATFDRLLAEAAGVFGVEIAEL